MNAAETKLFDEFVARRAPYLTGPFDPADTQQDSHRVARAIALIAWEERASIAEPAAKVALRDHFAGLAMVRITGADPNGMHGADILAHCAYALADAMLKERDKCPR